MSTVRPGFLSSKNTFEWCSDLSQLDKNIESIHPSDHQIAGGQLLKTLLDESDFPEPTPIIENDPISFSLSIHQYQLVKAACKIIRKTNLYLQNIEQNVPRNIQLVTLSVLSHLEYQPENYDPRYDPTILYHRWIIRSKSSDIDFGSELDPSENSVEVLETLLKSLDEDIVGYVDGVIPKTSLSYHIHNIFRIQLSYELGEYYFSRDIGKSVAYLCKCALEGAPYESTSEYRLFCTIDKDRLSALIKGTGFLTKKFKPSVQLKHFLEDQDYKGVCTVLFKSFENNLTDSIPLDETRALLREAVTLGQEDAAIQIAFYNVFNLSPSVSTDEMIDEIPTQCFQYLHDNFKEETIIKVMELLKAKYGNFFGQSLSENQRKFISLFFQKIEKDEIWGILRKIEGLEFLQYPVERIIERLALLNTSCKAIKAKKDEYRLSMKTSTKTCANCYRTRRKCSGSSSSTSCDQCKERGLECNSFLPSNHNHSDSSKGKQVVNTQGASNVLKPRNIQQPLPLPQITSFPSIFTTVVQNVRYDRLVDLSDAIGARGSVNSTLNDNQVQWEGIEKFIKSSFDNDKIDDEKLLHVEKLSNKALNNNVLLDLSVLENITSVMLDHCRWEFLGNFLTNILNSRSKNEWKRVHSSHYRFCKFMIACIEIFKIYSQYAQVIYGAEDSLETTYRKEFDIILRLNSDELKNFRVAAHRMIKSMDSADTKSLEPALGILTRLKNVKWAHHIVISLTAGHLCNRKAQRKQMQLNHQLYSPIMIIMMSSKCAEKFWPREMFYAIVDILDGHVKPLLHDITQYLLYLCIESEKHNEPRFVYDVRIADIYYLQGSPTISLRHSLNAVARVTSMYMFLNKIDILWPLHTIGRMISCCLSRKELMAAVVLHQFIGQDVDYIGVTKELIDRAIENETLRTSVFTKFVFNVEMLQYICKCLFERGDMTAFNQISEWLNMELNEQTPSIYRKNYIAENQGKQHQNNRHQNVSVKYKLRCDMNSLTVDATKQIIETDELKGEFLHELTMLVDEEND
ncbi:13610_t:CDS:10, partial [Acaulospora morrowiae]